MLGVDEQFKWPTYTTVRDQDVLVIPPEFNEMKNRFGEYSCSFPTGVYPGKKFVRNCNFGTTRKVADWWVAELVVTGTGRVDVKWRKVVLDVSRTRAWLRQQRQQKVQDAKERLGG